MQTRKHRVLIADDHALMAEGIRGLLASEYEVLGIATDGRMLVKQALELRPDVVCLDIGMPEMNGIQAGAELSRQAPRLKLVFVTQQLELPYLRAAFRAGASGYVAKQSASSELLQALKQVLGGRQYITPLLASEAESLHGELHRDLSKTYADRLTPRQREVLKLTAEGRTIKEISSALAISLKTVEFHKSALMNELGLRTTADLTRYALAHQLIA